jgi:fructan beta-fructosidase
MEFLCDSKYLLFPASHNAQGKRVYFYIGDRLVYDLVMALDYDKPDYEFPLNVERFRGQTLRLSSEPEMKIEIRKADTVADGHQAYTGKYRPLAHFTSKHGWLNDPNGLVYYNGKYLMFYQHNPVACTWENMHWGYASSTDLVHWEEHEIALFPDETGTMFSGSAIVDRNNVTGLRENENDVILLFYTAAGGTSETSKGKPFTQCLAYSTDGGHTFTKYSQNPLIGQVVEGNRDPKVIYHEGTETFVMALYLDNHEFALYSSTNLLEWNLSQKILLADDTECPDLYPLAVDGDEKNIKWVFSAAADRYYIGGFDGQQFTPETELKRLNFGNSSYAAQSWSDVPEGRRIRTACASVVIPGMPFGSCMNIPQEMSLRTVNDVVLLCAWPVDELNRLYLDTAEFRDIILTRDKPFVLTTDGKCYDISLQVATENCANFEISLFGLAVRYDGDKRELQCAGNSATVEAIDGKLDLRILIDTAYAEIFANQGSRYMGMTYIQDSNLNQLKIQPDEGNVRVESATVSKLAPFWDSPAPR